jgi:hypothetical protein
LANTQPSQSPTVSGQATRLKLIAYFTKTKNLEMFGNFAIADIIAYHCSRIDFKCRQELETDILVSERDYVTALSTRIRDELNIQFKLPCHSQTVRPKVEKENGVDGIIVFKWKNEVKAGLFEAKRPQIKIDNFNWDYLTKRNTSHFSEQIENQHKWLGAFALWEMFFNEGQSGFCSPPFDYFGTSCVWHDNAYAFMNKEALIFKPWTSDKLKLLLENSCTNFYSVIYDIISCKAGKRFKIDHKNQTARITSPSNKNVFMEIPLPFEIDVQTDEKINSFLNENNFYNYTFINLDSLEKSYQAN